MGETPKQPPARKGQRLEEYQAAERERARARQELGRKLSAKKSEPPERDVQEQVLMLRRDFGLGL